MVQKVMVITELLAWGEFLPIFSVQTCPVTKNAWDCQGLPGDGAASACCD